jgi:hypothetical protein
VSAALWVLCTLGAAACTPLHPVPPPPPPPAPAAAEPPAPPPAPAPAPPPVEQPLPELANETDLAARRLLACDRRLRRMSPPELATEISGLNALISSAGASTVPDTVLCLALALAQQHNPGDLARAASLLEPLAQPPAAADPSPAQPLARLLAGRIADQKRLEDELERQATQRRDTQRAIQQLTEKLEALKAIERSMTARPPPAPAGEAAAPATRAP